MNSISRAVTSRFNDISNKRQRLVGEGKDSDFVNPSWMDPTTSDFNCFEPPELIISEEDWNEIASTGPKLDKPKMCLDVKPSNNISKKVTSVVRRLSPFGSSNNLSKEKEEEKHDGVEEKKSQKIFKETIKKVDNAASVADEFLGATEDLTNFAVFLEENKHKREGNSMFIAETYLKKRKKTYGEEQRVNKQEFIPYLKI
ncbi:hypothetical protein Y032_0161g3383 [Ancylostoma ceylanicum]|uniref:Uncharacterized protein n=1 Tax=Ancylostoma ceylanicum TaxID=53326 RepID=A0A016SY40_9BILA|nr:hypothetical protein Y032_0161g3383 [Ancylostoma ceylanicum]